MIVVVQIHIIALICVTEIIVTGAIETIAFQSVWVMFHGRNLKICIVQKKDFAQELFSNSWI